MKNKDYGAFPSEPEGYPKEFGLTKREYCAAAALQGYLSGQGAWSDGDGGGATLHPEEVAKDSLAFADALLDALDKSEE